MAVLTRDDFFARLHERMGSDTSKETIEFIEDVTDTYNALENKDGNEDWKKKYDEMNNAWAEKYKHRFFSGNGQSAMPPNMTTTEAPQTEAEKLTFESLFKKKEG